MLNRITIIAVVFLGAFLRLYRIDYQSLWYDEAKNVSLANEFSIKDVWGEQDAAEPAFLIFILRPWIKMFGLGDNSVRFPSVILGIISLVLIYMIGKLIFSRTIGLFSAYILAISPLAVYYSQQAGYNSAIMPAGLLSMWLFCRVFKRQVGFLILTFINMLLIFIHPACFFMVIIQNLAVLLFIKDRAILKKWFLCQVPILINLMLWGLISARVNNIKLNAYWISPPTIKTLLATLEAFSHGVYRFAQGGTGFIVDDKYLFIPRCILLIYVFLLFYGLKSIKAEAGNIKTAVCVASLWLFVPPLFLFIFSKTVFPLYADRYLLYCAPAYYLLIVYGFSRINSLSKKLGILAVISFLHLFPLRILYEPSVTQIKSAASWRAIGEKVRRGIKPNDIIILSPLRQIIPFWRYYKLSTNKIIDRMGKETDENWEMIYRDGYNSLMGPEIGGADKFLVKYKKDTAAAERVWLVVSPWWPGQNGSGERLINFFSANYILNDAAEYPFCGVKVLLFSSKKP